MKEKGNMAVKRTFDSFKKIGNTYREKVLILHVCLTALYFYFPYFNSVSNLKDQTEILGGQLIVFHISKQIRKAKENRAVEKEGELCMWDSIDKVL